MSPPSLTPVFPVPFCALQEKQSQMEGLKQQLVEVETQRDEHSSTIGKLRQVTGESLWNSCRGLFKIKAPSCRKIRKATEATKVESPQVLETLESLPN